MTTHHPDRVAEPVELGRLSPAEVDALVVEWALVQQWEEDTGIDPEAWLAREICEWQRQQRQETAA